MGALIIAEHNNQQLLPATIATINAASLVTKNITILILGYNCQSVINQASIAINVTGVIYLDHINYQNLLAENISTVVIDIINNNNNYYKYIIAAANAFGKNLIPRIAAMLNLEQISEVTKIIDTDTFERFIYAGNAIQTVKLSCQIKCLTIRTINFNDEFVENDYTAHITKLNFKDYVINQRINFSNNQTKTTFSTRPELTTAKIVVAGGSGLKSKENFALLEQLADRLNAAIGASKSAVDAGFAPNSWQIGQTGKTIAPKLYIAVGISGAIQHIAGIKESKVIVAINLDENAPIVKIANYSIIGDLFKIIPEIIEELSINPQGSSLISSFTTKLATETYNQLEYVSTKTMESD